MTLKAIAAREGKNVMGEGLSLHLDILRVSAALLVVIVHALTSDMDGGWIKLPMVGMDAVIVFFVLSGFVIAYTVEKKNETLGHYIASRLARLWSVLIPALAVTVVLDYSGQYLFSAFYQKWEFSGWSHGGGPWEHPVPSVLVAASFSNELWFTSTRPLSNEPIWSLGFEFWYYAIFGAWFFLRNATRWIGTAICIVICGPKILLLMPIWLTGVFVYRWLGKHGLSENWGWVAFIAPLVVHLMIKVARPLEHTTLWEQRIFGERFFEMLGFAKYFPYLYIIGILVAVHFAGAAAIQETLNRWLSPFRGLIRNVSQHTLSIYLFHFPILLFISASLNFIRPGPMRSCLSIGITLAACFGLGSIFEQTRYAWRAWLEKFPLLKRLSRHAPSSIPAPSPPLVERVG